MFAFVNNIDWFTFFAALAVFIIVSNLFNLVAAHIRLKQSRENVAKSEKKLAGLKSQIRAKDNELDALIKSRGDK